MTQPKDFTLVWRPKIRRHERGPWAGKRTIIWVAVRVPREKAQS